jgi:hypothetical protein
VHSSSEFDVLSLRKKHNQCGEDHRGKNVVCCVRCDDELRYHSTQPYPDYPQ